MPHRRSNFSQISSFCISSQHTLVTLLILITLSFSLISLFTLHQDSAIILDWELLSLNSSHIRFPILIDPTGSFIAATVTFISFNIFIFSKSYISHDPNQTRFSHILLLFIFSIIALIFSPNLITLILGWDGLGITSFLLVIHYPTSDSLNRGIVTALTNRVGDGFILTAITLIMSQGTWNLRSTWIRCLNTPPILATIIVLAAMTKRAQLPFIVWLPEAIAAPTPVSALVHSSTLVTAGVYLIIRFHPFISYFKELNFTLLLARTFTLIASGIWATVELDIKKIIALSTLRQIAMIIIRLRLGLVSLAYLHLVSHAIFKSLLFLTVGVHITFNNHQQNIQNLETVYLIPSMAAPATVSLASLNAFFFTAGYFSKDLLVETIVFIYKSELIWNGVITALGTRVGRTITYSIRLHRVLCNSTKLVNPDGFCFYPLEPIRYVNDFNNSIQTPLIWLTISSLSIGRIAMWAFLTPFETPIIYLSDYSIPWFWTITGGITATSICAINHKLKKPHLSKLPNPQNPTSEIKLNPPIHGSKIETGLDSTYVEDGHRDHNEIISGITYLTWGVTPPIISLSLKIFKILDQGWLEIYPPIIPRYYTSILSKRISLTQIILITLCIFLSVILFTYITLITFICI